MPPGQVREAYNAKGRRSTAGSRKRGKRKPEHRPEEQPDPNAEILSPQSKDAKAKERQERLRQEVRFPYICLCVLNLKVVQLISQSDSKWTSKKKKRLDKYIVRHLISKTLKDLPFIPLVNRKRS